MRRLRRTPNLVATAALLAVVLSACGTSDTSDTSGTSDPSGTSGTSDPSSATPESDGQLVVANWGGATGDARNTVVHPLVDEKYGVDVVDVPGSVDYGKLRVMVDAGKPEWDLAITALSAYNTLGEDYFEPIDYERNPDLWDGVDTHPYGAPDHIGCEAIVYRTDAFAEGSEPTSWEDFWDTEAFPGKRALGADGGVPWFTLEGAIRAAGASPTEVYPIDFESAFAKLDELRDTGELEIWNSYAEGSQMLATGQVVIARMHVPTVWDLVADGTLGVVWPSAICWTEMIHIVKGANYDAAMDYIETVADPEVQAKMVQISKAGPVTSKALEFVPEEMRDLLPVPEEFASDVVWQDYAWYGDNYEAMTERWTEWQLGE